MRAILLLALVLVGALADGPTPTLKPTKKPKKTHKPTKQPTTPKPTKQPTAKKTPKPTKAPRATPRPSAATSAAASPAATSAAASPATDACGGCPGDDVCLPGPRGSHKCWSQTDLETPAAPVEPPAPAPRPPAAPRASCLETGCPGSAVCLGGPRGHACWCHRGWKGDLCESDACAPLASCAECVSANFSPLKPVKPPKAARRLQKAGRGRGGGAGKRSPGAGKARGKAAGAGPNVTGSCAWRSGACVAEAATLPAGSEVTALQVSLCYGQQPASTGEFSVVPKAIRAPPAPRPPDVSATFPPKPSEDASFVVHGARDPDPTMVLLVGVGASCLIAAAALAKRHLC